MNASYVNNTQSSKSGDITAAFRNDASGFTVNQGGMSSKQLLMLAAAVLVGALLWKKLR